MRDLKKSVVSVKNAFAFGFEDASESAESIVSILKTNLFLFNATELVASALGTRLLKRDTVKVVIKRDLDKKIIVTVAGRLKRGPQNAAFQFMITIKLIDL